MDHSKFETLEKNLKGATLVEHLIRDFEILNQFKALKIGLPVMAYASCIDLEILIKEMTDYDIPSNLQWKEIVWLGRTKCNFPGSSM
jgi:cobalamin biosynthesis Co2+ chelatase CbiK